MYAVYSGRQHMYPTCSVIKSLWTLPVGQEKCDVSKCFRTTFLLNLGVFQVVKFGNCRAIFCLHLNEQSHLKANQMKETPEERRERIRSAWKYFKEKHCTKPPLPPKEEFQTKRLPKDTLLSPNLVDALKNGHKGPINAALKEFWKNYESQTNEERLAALRNYADCKERITPKRLRKMRKRYDRHKNSLLNIPNCECGTCESLAHVRHHIIPLYAGGPNNPLNLILICNNCHAKIHPWMR